MNQKTFRNFDEMVDFIKDLPNHYTIQTKHILRADYYIPQWVVTVGERITEN